MELYNLTQLNWQPITHWKNSWNILHWLHTISYLFLRICCIVDGIVHFIWIRGWVNNYPYSVCGIYHYQFKKEKHHFSTCSPCLPIHFVHLSTSFFVRSQNSVYIFPHIFPSRGLCPWPTSCPSWEYYCTRHLIFNCFDSC